jgi:hypothetical protein
MNENVPYVWRKNYHNEASRYRELPEIAHEKARQFLNRAAAKADRSKYKVEPMR